MGCILSSLPKRLRTLEAAAMLGTHGHDETGLEPHRQKMMSFDESSMREVSDLVFIVENEKFYVSKLFMASQSKVLKAMFLGQFSEAEQKEVIVKETKASDFQLLSELVYGCDVIDDSTVPKLLRLIHYYDMPLQQAKVEKFLITMPEKTMKEKFELAKTYKLNELMKFCLSKSNDVEEINALVSSDEVKDLDEIVAKELLAKLLLVTKDICGPERPVRIFRPGMKNVY